MRRRISVCPIMIGFVIVNEFIKQHFQSIDEEGCGAVFAAIKFYEGDIS